MCVCGLWCQLPGPHAHSVVPGGRRRRAITAAQFFPFELLLQRRCSSHRMQLSALPPASLPPRCALPLEDTVTPAAAAADDDDADADARLGRRDPRSHTHSVSHDSLVSGRRHTCKLGWERGERETEAKAECVSVPPNPWLTIAAASVCLASCRRRRKRERERDREAGGGGRRSLPQREASVETKQNRQSNSE